MDSGDRWLAAWSLGYAAVGAASVLVLLYAIESGAGAAASATGERAVLASGDPSTE